MALNAVDNAVLDAMVTSLAIIDAQVFGAGTEAGALRVTLPTDGTGIVGLVATADVTLQVADGDVPGGAGVLTANVLRVTLATDDEINDDLDAIRIATELIDNAISGAGFNTTQLGGVNISLNTGVRDTGTQRVTIATDDAVPTVETAGLLHSNSPATEVAVFEVVGINEQVDASEYADEVSFAPVGTGKIVKICVITSETGSGVILTPAVNIIFFDADPTITVGDASITAAEAATIVADLSFSAADYQTDAAQGHNCQEVEESFHSITFATIFLQAGEVSVNSAAGDDEIVQLHIWYRRNS